MSLSCLALPRASPRPHTRAFRTYRRAPERSSRQITELLARYDTPVRPLNLRQLLSYGQPVTESSILESAAFVLHEIPRRLATRVRRLEGLPFIVGTNPFISNMLLAYRDSFQFLATYKPPTSLEENNTFAMELESLVENHANDIPTLAKGFKESSRYMSPEMASEFLDGAIRNRVSVRLIAEQHVALSRALGTPKADSIGIVDRRCSPRSMIDMCGSFVSQLSQATLGASPQVEIDGVTDATFPYVPVHLEYILTELLKNSFRASVEHHDGKADIPPVVVTISPPVPHSHGPKFLSLRIRDQGGGIAISNIPNIFSYAFTTAGYSADEDDGGGGPYAAQYVGGSAAIGSEGSGDSGNLFGEITSRGLQTGIGTIAGLGYGLPMSRLYTKYFGGDLQLKTLEGWGTDAYVKLRCLDEAVDARI
ncbi:atypical/PDHK/BCKDK protein kinase [Cylindrobasidium torrendii FP15055 ss-10]|uniref:Protein-serine/threonine kinase n=1 Tax=Cylindrobasidium torrendii FP15055 ss-10 TaxID=1314674 RepID=A0A0D7B5G4_9AGAR|nr:atypical/PDHK/BCKDK protein kinase [Cylindrobasidium torrendii FP15055 ss-10]